MSITIGNTTIYFWPLIVTLVIAVIASFLFTLYLSLRVRKVRKSFEAGVYDKAIIDGEQLLKTYQKLDKRYKHRLYLQHQRKAQHASDENDRWRGIFFIFCTATVSRHCSATLESPRIWQ